MNPSAAPTACLFLCILTRLACAAQPPSAPPNLGTIDPEGRTHIDRSVPVPETVSPEARARLAQQRPFILGFGSIAEQRAKTNEREDRAGAAYRKIYPVTMSTESIAGVPVRVVTPASVAPEKSDYVLLNLHGGGFTVDSGSQTESIPIAHLTGKKVVSVLYRMAPENPFPAAVEDAVSVYRELLKSYKPRNIGIYGTSAGAILTAETAAKLKQLGVPLPGLLGIFSGSGDFSKRGDSESLFGLQGLVGPLLPYGTSAGYVGKVDPRDPVLSPMYSDLSGMPPTLFVTSTRDALLSGTTLLHRAFLRAGNDARLVVFEALPHAFWLDPTLPESREANEIMARFLAGEGNAVK
jgi:acetyl esterase/lipase